MRARLVLFLGVLIIASVPIIMHGCAGFGGSPSGERLSRMRASPQWEDGGFANPQPIINHNKEMLTSMFEGSDYASPDGPLPVIFGGEALKNAPESGLRLTWMGHSTVLIELDGQRVLTDPIWGERASPFTWIGPKRWYEPPVPLEALPPVDAVIISHDHYDHLNHVTIEAMAQWDTTFITPLGVGAHLASWGVPEENIVELDWWEGHTLGGLTITATPSRHASGRGILDQNKTLWASYVLKKGEHDVYFSGDTGLFPAMAEIGERFGPFDVTMIEVGAYHRAWPDWHIGPEQAIIGHNMLKGELLMPIHWGLWNLALHGWTEPAERVLVAAEAAKVNLVMPRPGESLEPAAPPPVVKWWPEVPWETAEQHPIVSSQNDIDSGAWGRRP